MAFDVKAGAEGIGNCDYKQCGLDFGRYYSLDFVLTFVFLSFIKGFSDESCGKKQKFFLLLCFVIESR